MATLDITDDWMVMDMLQAVSYYSRQTEGVWSSALSCQMLKRENKRDLQYQNETLMTVGNEAIFELWASTMTVGFIPKFGDRFTIAGISGVKEWDVLSCDYADFTTRYRIVARQKDQGQ